MCGSYSKRDALKDYKQSLSLTEMIYNGIRGLIVCYSVIYVILYILILLFGETHCTGLHTHCCTCSDYVVPQ